MAFGADDAFFGLGGADEPVADSTDGFDLDRDDMNKEFDMSALDDSLPGDAPVGGMPPGGMPGMPPGMEDLDPKVLEQLMGLMSGGMPDPNKLKKLMTQNPALQKMMAQFAPQMGMDMPGADGSGGGGGGGGGNRGGRSQKERLQERLRQKRDAGEVNIPEVKSGSSSKTSTITNTVEGDPDDDDWGIPASTTASSGKKKNNKKKGGKKK